MIKLFYSVLILLIPFFSIKAQINTSLTDIYMGNYGFWDHQSTGSMQSLEQDSTNTQVYHSVYLTADSTLSGPAKRVLYFYSNSQGGTWINTVVANVNSSYPSLALQTDGRAVICFLDSAASKIRIYRTTAPGALTFDTLPSPAGTPGSDPKILFYRNYLLLFALLPGGQLQRVRYNYTTSSWGSWQTIASNVGQAYQVAKGWGGRVAACWISTINNPVIYIESLDSANTFGSPNTIFTQDITTIDTVRAFAHIDMVYTIPNQPAITWDAIARILPAGGQNGIRKFYHNPRIYFWSQTNGIRMVADTLNSGSVPGRNTMVSMGANWSPICGPSIGLSTNIANVIYITYSAAKINVPLGNSWYDSDFFIKYSMSGGLNWNSYLSFMDNTNDDRFVCMNKKTHGIFYSFAFIEQKDRFPGSFRMGDTNFVTRSHPEFYFLVIATHTLEESQSPSLYDLCPNYPNPFNSSTNIEYWLDHRAQVEIVVHDMLGRKVATLVEPSFESNIGTTHVVFDGTDYASGIYFYSMIVDGVLFDTKTMVMVK